MNEWVEAAVKAQALREAAELIIAPGASSAAAEWLRNRADQIERAALKGDDA